MSDRSKTQPAPNISTEHQRQGDARRPSDTLDREQPAGDAPEAGHRATIDRATGEVHGSGSGAGGNPGEDHDDDTAATNPVTPVEDRDNVGTVTPEDYPEKQ